MSKKSKKSPKTLTLTKNPNPSNLSQTLAITANLANLLPTGTLLAFQLLIPSSTNNGQCQSPSSLSLTIALLVLLSASAFLACFTDSIRTASNRVVYGFATRDGMRLIDPPLDIEELPDLRRFRIRVIDWVHGVLSVLVFVAVALRDKFVLNCFYGEGGEEGLDGLPIAIGVVCGMVFAVFPTTRRGIGYPVDNNGGFRV